MSDEYAIVSENQRFNFSNHFRRRLSLKDSFIEKSIEKRLKF
jgi:hypothetical protein